MFDFIIARNAKLCNWQLEMQAGSFNKGLEVKIYEDLRWNKMRGREAEYGTHILGEHACVGREALQSHNPCTAVVSTPQILLSQLLPALSFSNCSIKCVSY